MNEDELRNIMNYLRDRVSLKSDQANNEVKIEFNEPSLNYMIYKSLNVEGSERILNVSWWQEMVDDIIETPEMCDEEDTPQQILEYAKDVISEYIRKWFPLNEK